MPDDNTKKDDKKPKDRKLAGYAEELKKNGKYPLKPRTPWAKRGGKRRPGETDKPRRVPATPFLVVPNFTGDVGTFRPLNPVQARNSGAIQVQNAHTGAATTCVKSGEEYVITCKVLNTGAAGCYAGIAEFYAAHTKDVDAAAGGGQKLKPLGYAGVIVGPGQSTVVKLNKSWKPDAILSSVVARVYDPLVDKAASLYDGAGDRHVGRKDMVLDFSGTWDGMESANVIHNAPTKIKIVITQTNSIANVAIYSQAGGTYPATPQESGSAQVLGDHFVFNYTEVLGGAPFTSNVWTFKLNAQGRLCFTHHRHYLAPGDGRPDTNTTDLNNQGLAKV